MTRYEYIKSLNETELAHWICEEFTHAEIECENCPAYKYCYKGHNGMKHWLLEEHETQKTADKN